MDTQQKISARRGCATAPPVSPPPNDPQASEVDHIYTTAIRERSQTQLTFESFIDAIKTLATCAHAGSELSGAQMFARLVSENVHARN